MGQPRPDGDAIDYARFLGAAVGAAVEEAWSRRTPQPKLAPEPVQLELPSLKVQAAEADARAGRVRLPTPPPEEKTTCLHAEREPESSSPGTSPTETDGESSPITRLAGRMLQRLTEPGDPSTRTLLGPSTKRSKPA